jgi:hypothetical protein
MINGTVRPSALVSGLEVDHEVELGGLPTAGWRRSAVIALGCVSYLALQFGATQSKTDTHDIDVGFY